MGKQDRVILEVSVNLDPVPGAMDSPTKVASTVHLILQKQIGHYNPVVSVVTPPEEETFSEKRSRLARALAVFNAETRAQIDEMRAQGYSYRVIAAKLGAKESSVRRWAQK